MSKVPGVASPDHTLIQAGVALFLIGLLTGFAAPFLDAPRLGLTSHLVGLTNGLFLMALGLIWRRLTLPPWAGGAAFFAALYAGFANWLATLLAAIWGGAGMMPLASAGRTVGPVQEMVVSGLLVSLSLASVLACALVLWGLRKPSPRD